eukprot:2288251-Prymnesium_polylepis.1
MHKSACLLSAFAERSPDAMFPGLHGQWAHECMVGTAGSLLSKDPALVPDPSVRLQSVRSAMLPS